MTSPYFKKPMTTSVISKKKATPSQLKYWVFIYKKTAVQPKAVTELILKKLLAHPTLIAIQLEDGFYRGVICFAKPILSTVLERQLGTEFVLSQMNQRGQTQSISQVLERAKRVDNIYYEYRQPEKAAPKQTLLAPKKKIAKVDVSMSSSSSESGDPFEDRTPVVKKPTLQPNLPERKEAPKSFIEKFAESCWQEARQVVAPTDPPTVEHVSNREELPNLLTSSQSSQSSSQPNRRPDVCSRWWLFVYRKVTNQPGPLVDKFLTKAPQAPSKIALQREKDCYKGVVYFESSVSLTALNSSTGKNYRWIVIVRNQGRDPMDVLRPENRVNNVYVELNNPKPTTLQQKASSAQAQPRKLQDKLAQRASNRPKQNSANNASTDVKNPDSSKDCAIVEPELVLTDKARFWAFTYRKKARTPEAAMNRVLLGLPVNPFKLAIQLEHSCYRGILSFYEPIKRSDLAKKCKYCYRWTVISETDLDKSFEDFLSPANRVGTLNIKEFASQKHAEEQPERAPIESEAPKSISSSSNESIKSANSLDISMDSESSSVAPSSPEEISVESKATSSSSASEEAPRQAASASSSSESAELSNLDLPSQKQLTSPRDDQCSNQHFAQLSQLLQSCKDNHVTIQNLNINFHYH